MNYKLATYLIMGTHPDDHIGASKLYVQNAFFPLLIPDKFNANNNLHSSLKVVILQKSTAATTPSKHLLWV